MRAHHLKCASVSSSGWTVGQSESLPDTHGTNSTWRLRFWRYWRLCCCCCCSGFWRRVDSSVDAKVSEKHTLCCPEDGDGMFLRNLVIYRRVWTARKPGRATLSLTKCVFWCQGSIFHHTVWRIRHFVTNVRRGPRVENPWPEVLPPGRVRMPQSASAL
jgi:hypothetical protein